MDTTAITSVIADVVTTDMLSGVLNEMLGMLPVIIPVSVTFIGIRKGLGFLFGSLRKA